MHMTVYCGSPVSVVQLSWTYWLTALEGSRATAGAGANRSAAQTAIPDAYYKPRLLRNDPLVRPLMSRE
jgi:hypothetical protein